MNLDKILNDPLEKLPRKYYKHNKPTPQQKHVYNIRYCLKLLKTGSFNPENKQHQILLSVAVKAGYADRDLNILKEI